MEITLEPQSTDYFSHSRLLLGKLFCIPLENISLINLLGSFGDLCIEEVEPWSQLSPERNNGWIYELALLGLEIFGEYCKGIVGGSNVQITHHYPLLIVRIIRPHCVRLELYPLFHFEQVFVNHLEQILVVGDKIGVRCQYCSGDHQTSLSPSLHGVTWSCSDTAPFSMSSKVQIGSHNGILWVSCFRLCGNPRWPICLNNFVTLHLQQHDSACIFHRCQQFHALHYRRQFPNDLEGDSSCHICLLIKLYSPFRNSCSAT